tara:strand:- start:59 stop:280 length:222 start_codon:yes stop_codon:yes gene_type:complete
MHAQGQRQRKAIAQFALLRFQLFGVERIVRGVAVGHYREPSGLAVSGQLLCRSLPECLPHKFPVNTCITRKAI